MTQQLSGQRGRDWAARQIAQKPAGGPSFDTVNGVRTGIRLLKEELEAQGRKSKSWTSAAGRVIGGKLFSRGALYLMLRNRIYQIGRAHV